MRSGLFELKSDTWAIIGAGAAMAAIMMTVMLALNAATNARISEQTERLDARISEQTERLDARISEQTERLDARINEQGERLGARIDAQEARIDMLYDAMRNEHALILESLAGIAQRVSYIEGHLVIGRATDHEPAGPP